MAPRGVRRLGRPLDPLDEATFARARSTCLFFYLPFGLLAVVLARLAWRRLWALALLVEVTAMALVFAAIGIYQYETRDVFWNPKLLVANAYAPFYRVNSVFWDPSDLRPLPRGRDPRLPRRGALHA